LEWYYLSLALRIDTNVIAFIVSIIFLKHISSRLDIKEKQNKAFITIFTFNTLQLFIETLTCILNKQPYTWLIPICTLLHVILFLLGPLITYQWFKFASLWIKKENGNDHKKLALLIPLAVNTILVLLTPLYNLAFYIDQHNVYHRGPLFFIPVIISYFYLLCGFILVYKNNDRISRIEFLPLLLFGVLPAVGGFIQAVFYGFLLIWSSITFSLIILYLYLQQQMIHIDYLTGAWTRERFYNYLVDRIDQKKPRNFSIVFIDLDNFKKVNDAYGHAEGDRVLIDFVYLIKKTLKDEDFITRYGGDEFVLFLNMDSEQEVEELMGRASEALDAYNRHVEDGYELAFSYGYELYNFDEPMTADEYIMHVDKLMYQKKNSKKLKSEA
jgi:diguanylate cyclase (GGDEF)-like protein